jgi:hypothetical protein
MRLRLLSVHHWPHQVAVDDALVVLRCGRYLPGPSCGWHIFSSLLAVRDNNTQIQHESKSRCNSVVSEPRPWPTGPTTTESCDFQLQTRQKRWPVEETNGMLEGFIIYSTNTQTHHGPVHGEPTILQRDGSTSLATMSYHTSSQPCGSVHAKSSSSSSWSLVWSLRR